jgi:hypothetical protein
MDGAAARGSLVVLVPTTTPITTLNNQQNQHRQYQANRFLLFELEIRIGVAFAMWLAAQSNGWSSSTRVLGGVGSHHDSTTTMNDH